MRNRRRDSFVLLEVLIAMTILGVTVAMVLNSFSRSLSAVTQIEAKTQAVFFAQQLMDDFEVHPPTAGRHEGGFGDAYWQYHYEIDVEYEEPDYDQDVPRDVDTLFPVRKYTLEIFYDNGRNKAFRALEIQSAIIGAEKFSAAARRELKEY